jgi:xanthine dehydrogenase accessory factor
MQKSFSTASSSVASAICYGNGVNGAPFFQPDATQHQVLEQLIGWTANGVEAALVVITAIEGRTSRSVGSLMAVSAPGDVVGSISRALRLGEGSPWIDVKLPCGGGLDLLIVPNRDSAMLGAAAEASGSRDTHRLRLDRPDGDPFVLVVKPRLRLIVAGNGGEVAALAGLSLGIDAEVVAVSPERALLDSLPAHVQTVHLKTPDSLDDLAIDSATAVAVFFHDHDWEPPLLAHAVSSDAFFIGAMGSLDTHDARCVALREKGLSETAIARIASPLGLFAPARDPQALAVSALAQILSFRP